MELQGISSMATRQLLADLAGEWHQASGNSVSFESIGGVEAARRVAAHEVFDVVVLASDAIERLLQAGRVRAGSRVDVVSSQVAIAVPAGAPHPAVGTAEALRAAVLAASRVGYSTGPSGNALLALFRGWGILEQVEPRLVQARPGVPVGSLVASGEATLGFQQLSELLGLGGIDLLGCMPDDCAITTIFSGAVCATARQPRGAAELLSFLGSPPTEAAKRRHGMSPA